MKDGSEIGKISKQWPGLMKEMFTDSDNFRVTCKLRSEHVDGYKGHLFNRTMVTKDVYLIGQWL